MPLCACAKLYFCHAPRGELASHGKRLLPLLNPSGSMPIAPASSRGID